MIVNFSQCRSHHFKPRTKKVWCTSSIKLSSICLQGVLCQHENPCNHSITAFQWNILSLLQKVTSPHVTCPSQHDYSCNTLAPQHVYDPDDIAKVNNFHTLHTLRPNIRLMCYRGKIRKPPHCSFLHLFFVQ